MDKAVEDRNIREKAAKAPRSRVSGIERSIQILDALTEKGVPASAYDIAKSVKAPMSTVYSIVDELTARRMLTKVEGGLIWLGPRLLRYGLAYQAKVDLLVEAKREMVRLCAAIGETVQICSRDEGMMVVTAMADGDSHFRISSDVGTRVPVNWTASGRLLLGHLPLKERRAAFERYSQPSPTGRAELDAVRLAEQAGEDFQNRLAVQLGASEFSVACIASPIRDAAGTCAATISIVLAEEKARRKLDFYADQVKASAAAVENALGHTAG
ncbi:IclR family transcriptional regulator [Chelativorans alearense]|uniref:IclR family transcriptional regulator n=1 Tax=Chelativorans alearense TaxID=2681495 RepID=UPI001FE66D55|nr:IclR family transcriptional regulator [Chelativorans alearense]